jgi:hypothetical protein
MASTLLIIGLTLFLMGTVMLAMDAQHRGRSSLMFALPFAGASYIHHYWSDIWLPALLRVVGIALVAIAVAVTIARDPLVLERPGRVFGVAGGADVGGSKRAEINTFANSQAAVLLAIRSDANPRLTGRLRGIDFNYSQGRLVNGVLSVQQGEGFIPEIEVRILLGLEAASITRERMTLFVRPSDEVAPELQITWRSSADGVPHTDIVRSGYQMELQLSRRDPQTLSGFLQVILPDPERSYLSGELTVRTNYLRYVNDRVDLAYDHPDTLEYVGRQYLETQFPENTIREMQFSSTRLLLSESGGVSTATVVLVNGQIEERRLQFDRADIGWAVKPGTMQTVILQEAGNTNLRLVQPGSTSPRTQATVEVPPPLTLPFAALETLNGQQATVFQRDGRSREGIVRGIRRNRLMIESMVGGGVAEFSYVEAELQHLQLASGQQVFIAGGAIAADAPLSAPVVEVAPVAEAPVKAAEPEAAKPTSVAYSALLGKQVTITSRDTRTRTGILTDVTERQLTLSVRVGAGNLEYFYAPADIVSLQEVKR